MRGAFITLEGADGCGKSTQAALLAEDIEAAGHEVVRLREPGGTPIGEKIRALVLDPANGEMAPECELLLFEAARAQLVRQVIGPALARGAVVVCDRFYDSTYAYQAAGRALDTGAIHAANALGSCGVTPDLTIVLDLPTAEALARATRGGADRLEGEGVAFQERVRQGYLDLAAAEPARVRVVPAAGTVADVRVRIAREVAGLADGLLACDAAHGQKGA